MVGRTSLETRVRSLLRDNPGRGRQGRLSVAATVALVCLFLAAGGLYVRSAETPTPASTAAAHNQGSSAVNGPANEVQSSTHVLTGRVLTPENQLAVGAVVTLIVYEDSAWKLWHAETNAEGMFRFDHVPGKTGEHPSRQVLVQKAGSGLGTGYYSDAQASVEVHLSRPVQMTVRLATPDGKPIGGLQLRVRMLVWPEQPGPLVELPELADNPLNGRTDADGRCVFRDLPVGAEVMLAQPDERYAQFGFGSWVNLGERAEMDAGTLTLAAAATISGSVRYATAEARPAVNVMVHAQPRVNGGAGNADTFTDAQGHFTLRQMAAGAYDLHCYLRGQMHEDWASPPRDTLVAPGQTQVDQDLTLTRGALITGRITAADTGKGVAGIPVGTVPRPETFPGGNVFGESKPDGTYSLRVVPGKQHVYIATDQPGDYKLPDKHAVDVEVKEGETFSLDFVLPLMEATDFLSGRVVDSGGKPVPGADLFVCLPGEWLFVTREKADAKGLFRVHVPEIRGWEGRAKLPAPVNVRLFSRTEAGLVTAQGVDAKGGARDIVLKLVDHALAQVSGRATDAEGHPMENVPVRAYVSLGDLPGCNRVVRTDAQGGFTFDGLWPGLEYSFSTESPGYTRESVGKVTLTPGERRQLSVWKLAPAHLSIAGKVVDALGHPVPGALIGALTNRVGIVSATTDANGAFRLEGLVEAWLTLEVNVRQPSATSVRVKAGDQQVLIKLPAPREATSRAKTP